MTYKAKGLPSVKGFSLEPVKSLPPHERVAHLVNSDQCPDLTYLSIPYESMEFPIGVFSRAYEEFHYLDMIMCKAATAHMAKEFMGRPKIDESARGHSVLEEAARIQKEHDDLIRKATGNVGYDLYQAHHGDQIRDLAMGSGVSAFEEAERLDNAHKATATERLQAELERAQASFDNSLGSGLAGGALNNSLFSRSSVESALERMDRFENNPFKSLVDKEITLRKLEGLEDKKHSFESPGFEPPPLPKFETPKFDKTDEVKNEERERHLETLKAGEKLYDLQQEAKKDHSERLDRLLEAQGELKGVQERMELNSSKSERKMFWLGCATLGAAVAAILVPVILDLNIPWKSYFSQAGNGVITVVRWIGGMF
ncbi:hypothetical protein [Vreelandella sp. TE19]